jgi:hypothetical protein
MSDDSATLASSVAPRNQESGIWIQGWARIQVNGFGIDIGLVVGSDGRNQVRGLDT